MKTVKRNIGEDFRPEPQLKTLYYIYTVVAFVFGFLSWMTPVLIFAPFMIAVMIGAPVLIILIFAACWIPKYYKTVIYRLTGDEMTWRRGVWFRKTGIVPYNRITNIDISQGPVSRKLGIASLKIQTAGYSVTAARSSEIQIEGIRDFEGLRETIMDFVRGRKPVATETYGQGKESAEPKVIKELVRIRKLLEKRR